MEKSRNRSRNISLEELGTELSVRNLTKAPPPRVPFQRFADHILGKHGSVSLVFTSPALSKRLNSEKRGKNYTANVLTFPFQKRKGEVFICLSEARKNAPAFGLSYRDMVALLFIHALLHLKGVPHGGTMDRTEQRLLKRFQSSRGF